MTKSSSKKVEPDDQSAVLRLTTAGKDVVASGTVITFDSKNVEFHIANLRISLDFIDDGGATRMEGDVNETAILKLRLYNFNNSIGSGTTSPMEIGQLNGRVLWLAFMVYAISNKASKTVHYTLMLGDQV